MRKLTLTMFAILLSLVSIKAQSSCTDLNGYVDSKNTAGTGYYTLINGFEEKAAQTYHYSGPGRVSSVRVYGNYPGILGGVPLRVGIYDVDANGRPTTQLQATNDTWWWFDNFTGYITVNFGGGGVYVDENFAVIVEIRNASPWGNTFQMQYTGDGEGLGQDLASLAGTSTGNNWTSAMTNFSKDGDFYLVPRMTHFIEPAFSVSSQCVSVSSTVSFTNQTAMTTDSMFNTIGLAGYAGSNEFYTWDFGDGSPLSYVANPTHAYSAAGSYTVTLTATIDGWNNDCSASTSVVISVGLSAAASTTNATCYGTATGSITVTGSGGTPPYEYQLGGGTYQSGNVFNNLGAGTYTVNVMDDLGCIATTVVIITQPAAIVISNVAVTNSSCGSADGALVITASGGTGALQYQLNSSAFQSGNQFNNLASGSYTITVRDANGCTTVGYANVNDAGSPVLSVLSQTHVSCFGGSNGTIVLNGTGGSGTLQYSIDGGANWQTSGSFTNVTAGVHLALVKDASGCTSGMLITTMQPDALAFMTTSTNVSCNGDNDGSISVNNVTGGTGTFSYSLNNVNYQSGSTFSGLVAATYTVYVKDIAGCIASSSVTITQPSAIVATTVITDASCSGDYSGSITVNTTGGTPGYTYSIDGENFQSSNVFGELSAGTYTITIMDDNECVATINATVAQPSTIAASITTGASTCGNSNGTLLVAGSGGSGSGYQYSIDGTTFSGSGSFSGLSSGNYSVIVMDGAGCIQVFSTSINDANGPSITSLSSTDVACNEGADGTITINTVTGGTGTLEYSVNGSVWQTSNAFTGLEAGAYNVLVQDANGCVGQSTVTLTEPSAIVVTTSVVNVTCYGGFTGVATLNAAGGSGTLAYSVDSEWGFQSSNVFTGLYAGNYLAVVRDAAGCTGSVPFVITQPNQIIITSSVLNVMCSGDNTGVIYTNASGGTGTLQYSLDGITYQSGTVFGGLTADNYTIYVQDANGCVETHEAIVAEPVALTVNYTVLDVVCAGGNDGVIDLTVNGGIYPYTFDWSNNEDSEDIFNLSAGTYSVTVTDANGCSMSLAFTVTEPANPIVVNANISDASGQTAADGGVDITPTGGTAPFTFLWSNGATTEDISNVTPGVYTVIITDANGCVTSGTYVVSFTIGINDPAAGSAINLYPNPAHESFTIDAGTAMIDKLEVMDMLGQVVYAAQPNTVKTQVNTDGLSQGVYFVRIYTKGQMITKRLEVSK